MSVHRKVPALEQFPDPARSVGLHEDPLGRGGTTRLLGKRVARDFRSPVDPWSLEMPHFCTELGDQGFPPFVCK